MLVGASVIGKSSSWTPAWPSGPSSNRPWRDYRPFAGAGPAAALCPKPDRWGIAHEGNFREMVYFAIYVRNLPIDGGYHIGKIEKYENFRGNRNWHDPC
ncbi:hypothetical protein [Sphingomonas sp. MM-1]|uniref:hypothetical protein n=1 Tax=Sphingomonas sp. MM-1 TaxID=745310 RepID=UPI001182E8E8|nr:hypothetical protein [Sphingomonas sp. MM-1]